MDNKKISQRTVIILLTTIAVLILSYFSIRMIKQKSITINDDAVTVVCRNLKALRDDDVAAWKLTVTEDRRQQPTFNNSGSFWVNSLVIESISISDEFTEFEKERLTGSELAQARGWTDEYIQNMIIVKAVYTVDYDNTKVPTDSGKIARLYFLSKTDNNSPYLIFESGGTAP